jgi:hypothetical protein
MKCHTDIHLAIYREMTLNIFNNVKETTPYSFNYQSIYFHLLLFFKINAVILRAGFRSACMDNTLYFYFHCHKHQNYKFFALDFVWRLPSFT